MARRPALDIISHSPEQTRQIGARVGRLALPGDLILLSGQVGAGKTAFVQGVARGLGVRGYVQSPTFALANEHAGCLPSGRPVDLYHLDFYRLEGADDLVTFGYDEYLDAPQAVVAVEWPERLALDLPDSYLLAALEHLADTKRRIVFQPHGERYLELVDALRKEVFGVRGQAAAPGDR